MEGPEDKNDQSVDSAQEAESNLQKIDEKSESEETITDDSASGSIIQGRGCLKGCLVPILVIFLIVASLIMLAHAKRDSIRHWIVMRIISNTQDRVINGLSNDVDKKKAEEIFKNVKNAFKEGYLEEKMIEEAINEYIEKADSLMSPEDKKAEIDKLLVNLSKMIDKS